MTSICNSGNVRHAFSEQRHALSTCMCMIVTDISARKDALQRCGRYYICLQKGHISQVCQCTACCDKCHGRHAPFAHTRRTTLANHQLHVYHQAQRRRVLKVQAKHLGVLINLPTLRTSTHRQPGYNFVLKQHDNPTSLC